MSDAVLLSQEMYELPNENERDVPGAICLASIACGTKLEAVMTSSPAHTDTLAKRSMKKVIVFRIIYFS